MTHVYLNNLRKKQMELYIDYLPHCATTRERIALLDEIQELKFKIVRAGQMTVSESHETVKFKSVTMRSKINNQ